AMVKGLAEQCEGDAGGKIHLGATSADITENVKAILLKQSLELIVQDSKALHQALLKRAKQHMDLICIDRTHGQHAVPSTYGFMFAGYADQIGTITKRLESDLDLIVGKLAGAVGTSNTYKELGIDGIDLERRVLKKLGIKPSDHSRQIPPRDMINCIIADTAIMGTAMEKITSDLWNLGRTEIQELREATSSKQIGSSTMPHKKNPFRLERIMGMSSILRGNLVTILELGFTHGRDLKQSAADRYKLPETFITLDYMLNLMKNLITFIQVNEKRVTDNVYLTKGSVMAERVMTALAESGFDRQEAHETVKQLAWKAMDENKMLEDLLVENQDVTKYLSVDKIRELMKAENYIGYAKERTQHILNKYNYS
ncbi:MAG: adenylosuccinate lyase, partial [Candidatus Diapherotrites archaeon]|nr:adenylosuccinate lyase [Candidatus Diapherotrites archaeon]